MLLPHSSEEMSWSRISVMLDYVVSFAISFCSPVILRLSMDGLLAIKILEEFTEIKHIEQVQRAVFSFHLFEFLESPPVDINPV